MSAGWQQVWDDIRNTLRGGVDAIEAQEDVLAGEQEQWTAEESRDGAAEGVLDEASVPPLPQHLTALLPKALPGMLALILITGVAAFVLRDRILPDRTPPAPNVVATYSGGQITLTDVQEHLELLVPEERVRGEFTHPEDYRLVIEEMVTDELVRRWASERKAQRDDSFQHAMKHITEDISLGELHTQFHQEGIDVSESEIRDYYEANRDQFGDRPLSQVRGQIQSVLQTQQEDQFVQDYIGRLKENATITRNFDLLEVPEPTDDELQAYYEANRDQFMVPAQATVDEIRIPIGEDESEAREYAENALAQIRSGAEFAAVAEEFSETPPPESGITVSKGMREPAYDEVVFELDEGQVSDVFRAGDAFYVVRLRSITPQRRQSLDEVRAQVRQAVLAEKEAGWFEQQADRTLFTLHGKRYTVGEFWREYQELPPTFVTRYQGDEGREALAERLIERVLLVEDSYDQLLDVKNEGKIDEARLDVLAQMMEQEEVDDKIEVTDEEVRTYYDEHRSEIVPPPEARVRYIMIRIGQTEDAYKRAWEKANEAYEKLVPGLFQDGADFTEVAREYSEAEVTAENAGIAERWVREGPDLLSELNEHPFHELVLSLREGEISHPFEWNGAIYIVQVMERKEPQPMSFEEAKPLIREELRAQKHQQRLRELSQRLMEQANVTIYDETLQQLVERQVSATEQQ